MKRGLMFLALLLLLTGCQAVNNTEENKEENNSDNVVVEQEEFQENEESTEEEGADDTKVDREEYKDIDMVLYNNKAVGYEIMRPDNWYWRHYINSQIKAAGGNSNIDDYLIVSPDELSSLGSEYLGPIVIEKSDTSEEEFMESMEGSSSQSVKIDGLDANKYQWQLGEQYFVAYILEKDGSTLRFIHQSSEENPATLDVFEKMVESFKFTE